MDCINHEAKAWDVDLTSQTIANCFREARFDEYDGWDDEDDIASCNDLIVVCKNLRIFS